jgi:hypothetical protein
MRMIKKCPNYIINHPRGENLPNLVTLTMSEDSVLVTLVSSSTSFIEMLDYYEQCLFFKIGLFQLIYINNTVMPYKYENKLHSFRSIFFCTQNAGLSLTW